MYQHFFASFLLRLNKDVFPLSKSEVQSKPEGVTLYDARHAYQATLQSRAYKIEDKSGERFCGYI